MEQIKTNGGENEGNHGVETKSVTFVWEFPEYQDSDPKT